MREDYSDQLKQIEAEFDRERFAILEKNEEIIQSLFQQHKQVEETFLHERQKNESDNSKQLEEVMSQDANKQAEEKIKLETEMQVLEKCMEDMKAVYKLNDEKLGFNLQVLRERSNVNKKTEKALKKKGQSEKEKERNQRKDFFRAQLGFQSTNQQLTQKYKEFTTLFKDL